MTVQERIESRIVKDPSGCWLWAGSLSRGYGQITILYETKKVRSVHRVYWELINGPIPEGMYVCHHCDIRNCINPDHLFVGTHTDNMKDMVKKGRQCKTSWRTGITHCKRGHLFNEENTRYSKQNGNEYRRCRMCERLLYLKKKANG